MAKEAKKTAAAAPEYAGAMDKLRDEMAKNNRRYVQVVGEFLTDYLLRHPEAEAAILDRGKSITGSLAAMKAEASKQKEGSVAVLDDAAAFAIVLRYFGIEADKGAARQDKDAPGQEQDVTGQEQDARGQEQYVAKADPFDLDALMGGVL